MKVVRVHLRGTSQKSLDVCRVNRCHLERADPCRSGTNDAIETVARLQGRLLTPPSAKITMGPADKMGDRAAEGAEPKGGGGRPNPK